MIIRGTKAILNELIELEDKITKVKTLANDWGLELEEDLLVETLLINFVKTKD
ncbi:MAG: hypothetical protein GY909_17220 [Oligoflexia bacterium]|nr:hypothetical protein [Oligoflexia bacterium]